MSGVRVVVCPVGVVWWGVLGVFPVFGPVRPVGGFSPCL